MFSKELHKKMQGLAKRAFRDVTGEDFVCDDPINFYAEFDQAVWALTQEKQKELDSQIDAYLRGDYNIPAAADRKLN